MTETPAIQGLGLGTAPVVAGSPVTSNPVSLFLFDGSLSEENLQDLAVKLGANGYPRELLEEGISRQEQQARREVEVPLKLQLARIVDTKRDLQANIREVYKDLGDVRLAGEQSQVEQESAQAGVSFARAKKVAVEWRLRQIKLVRRREVLDEQDSRLAGVANEAYDGLLAQFSKAEQVHEAWCTAWDKDRDELQRRARYYQSEVTRIEVKLGDADAQLHLLKQLGITRIVAGFLTWGGYLWLAANAALMVLVLGKLPGDSSPDLLAQLTNTLAGWIHGQPFWMAFGWYLAYVLGTLALITLATLGTDRLLTMLHPKWSTAGLSEGSSGSGGWSALWSGLTRMFSSSVEQQLRDHDPATPPRSTRLTRDDYLFLVALVPPSLLIAVGVFLVAASQAGAGTPSGPSLTALFLATVWSIMTASGALLYVCHVVNIRWFGLAKSDLDWGALSWRRRLFLNWEYFVLGLSFVVTTVFLTVESTLLGGAHPGWIWSCLLVSFALASLTLAYGIVLKGLFRDQRRLSDIRDLHQSLLDAALAKPCLTDLLDFRAVRRTGTLIGEISLTRHKLRELRILGDLERQYALETENFGAIENLLNHIAGRLGLSVRVPVLRSRRESSAGDILKSIEVPEPVLNQWMDLEQEDAFAVNRGVMKEIEIRACRRREERLQGELEQLRGRLDKLDQEHLESIRRAEVELRGIAAKFQRARWVAMSAYILGLRFYRSGDPLPRFTSWERDLPEPPDLPDPPDRTDPPGPGPDRSGGDADPMSPIRPRSDDGGNEGKGAHA